MILQDGPPHELRHLAVLPLLPVPFGPYPKAMAGLVPDRVLYYTLKATGGRQQSATRQVAVVAGRSAVVHLDFAPARPRRPALTRSGR